MRVLVFAHQLEYGGTQTNAIDLAAEVRSRFSHELVLFAAPGPARGLAEARGLEYLPAPPSDRHPSLTVMRALRAAVARVRPDLIHVWDWPQCLNAYFGVHLTGGVPMLCTVMSMTYPTFLPRRIAMTLGTPQLAAEARQRRAGMVDLLVPPVDVDADNPASVPTEDFRERFVGDDELLNIVIVSRLVNWLKLESLQRSIEAVSILGEELPVRLIIVGEGPAEPALRRRAQEINGRLGRDAIIFTGGMLDPRPAYAVADIVIGMGSSALRAMSFARALIVVGEEGFSEIIGPETMDGFLWQGFYGVGTGLGNDPLVAQLRSLVASEPDRRELGGFGRKVVREHFALGPTADRLEGLYNRVLAAPTKRPSAVAEGVRTLALGAGSAMMPGGVRTGIRRVRRSTRGRSTGSGPSQSVVRCPKPR